MNCILLDVRIMGKYRSYSYDEYLRAMELLKDHGLTEVCRILGWPTEKKESVTLLEISET